MPSAYKKGVRNFVVQQTVLKNLYPDANIIVVNDVLIALQQLASYHRKRFNIPVIGITGSNGKTIVKEWLYQLLSDEYNIVRSPKSFNSQLGVPLSILQMGEQHTLGIFEAGISHPGEMQHLQKIIQPTIGILTNIGQAHSAGFSSKAEKLQEKLLLFTDADYLIGETSVLANAQLPAPLFSWGNDGQSNVEVLSVEKKKATYYGKH